MGYTTPLLIIIIILLIIIFWKRNDTEHLITTSSGLSFANEAVQNVSSVYANTSGTVTFNNAVITGNVNFAQFKGVIVIWSGSVTNIPAGWGLCDGTTYTALDGTTIQSPDLRSKFVLGASKPNTSLNSNTSGPTGQPSMGSGTTTVWLTPRQVGEQNGEEKHTLSLDEIPSHNHNIRTGCTGTNCPMNATGVRWHGEASYSWFSSSELNGGGAGGVTTPHNNMPPYYSLAYIIKL